MDKSKSLPIVLMTDFGPQSPYVGQMKLVIERLAPGTPVIDLAHDIPAQNISAGCLVLSGSAKYVPLPCVLCAVVDPGVGSQRAVLAARYADGLVALAPDNGLIGALTAGREHVQLVTVTQRAHFLQDVSPVFHGRDIFAPVAAKLANGLALSELGEDLDPKQCQPIPWPMPKSDGNTTSGQIIYIDHFGNLITNLGDAELSRFNDPEVILNARSMPLSDHYAAVGEGQVVALRGSYEHVEIAVRNGSAADELGAKVGDRVELRPS